MKTYPSLYTDFQRILNQDKDPEGHIHKGILASESHSFRCKFGRFQILSLIQASEGGSGLTPSLPSAPGRVKVWAGDGAGRPCLRPLVCRELCWGRRLQGLWLPPLLCCAKCSSSACRPYHHFKAARSYISFIAGLSSSQSERMTWGCGCSSLGDAGLYRRGCVRIRIGSALLLSKQARLFLDGDRAYVYICPSSSAPSSSPRPWC